MEIKSVVKKENAAKRIFKGVHLDSLAVGEKSMVYLCDTWQYPSFVPCNKSRGSN